MDDPAPNSTSPPLRATLEERLAAARARQRRAAERVARLKATARAAQRRAEARGRFLLGTWLLHELRTDAALRARLREGLAFFGNARERAEVEALLARLEASPRQA